MECLTCRNLKQAYDASLGGYIEARSSACYGVSKGLAAAKNVEMERAWYELEEHRLLCVSLGAVLVVPPKRRASVRLKHRAA